MRIAALVYGGLAYLAFLGVFALLLDFAGPAWLVRGIDERPTHDAAIAIDVALIAAFGLVHSVMARSGFKAWWTRVVPAVVERSTYVLIASAQLALLVWQWRAMPDLVWSVPRAVYAVGLAGIGIIVLSTFLTNHFDLFGLRQVWLHAQRRDYTPVPFIERSLYRFVRHPMMVGFLLWLWAVPVMTVGRLVFAAGLSLYIFIGVAVEERALSRHLGAAYDDYRRRVRAFVPLPRR